MNDFDHTPQLEVGPTATAHKIRVQEGSGGGGLSRKQLVSETGQKAQKWSWSVWIGEEDHEFLSLQSPIYYDFPFTTVRLQGGFQEDPRTPEV